MGFFYLPKARKFHLPGFKDATEVQRLQTEKGIHRVKFRRSANVKKNPAVFWVLIIALALVILMLRYFAG